MNSCSVTNDIHVGLLDIDLPSNIKPAKVLPPSYTNYIGTARLLPVITFDQEEKLLICDSNPLRCFEEKDLLSSAQRPQNSARQEFYEDVVSGDSGNPRFLLIDNDLVLLYVMWRGGGGSGCFVTHFIDEIQTKMNVLQMGYQLELFDLSCYQKLTDDAPERWVEP